MASILYSCRSCLIVLCQSDCYVLKISQPWQDRNTIPVTTLTGPCHLSGMSPVSPPPSKPTRWGARYPQVHVLPIHTCVNWHTCLPRLVHCRSGHTASFQLDHICRHPLTATTRQRVHPVCHHMVSHCMGSSCLAFLQSPYNFAR